MYLLDTCIFSYFMKDSYPHLTEKILSFDISELLISSITMFELQYGAAKNNWGLANRQKLAMFLAPFTVIPFSTDDAVAAGALRAHLKKLGSPIGPYDLLIAAQGVSRNLTVVTHNTDEFIRVPGIQLEDWVQSCIP